MLCYNTIIIKLTLKFILIKSIEIDSSFVVGEYKLTGFREACRRKNALHDMHVITSKFIPRATSLQTRQIKGECDVCFDKIFLDSICKKMYVICR